MAFEALNHAGSLDVDMLVILNDNDMSISENVGAFSNYFARVLSGKLYATLREGSKKVLSRMPTVWELARRSEEHMKGMVLPGTIFEEMGFNYIGPIDGHDVHALVATLKNLRDLKGPQFLHVITRKGKGYAPAEADPIKWHGPGPFDPKSGVIFKEKASGPSYSQVFGQWLCDMADARSARRRHHAGDARRLGPGRILEALPGSLLRRRDRRTARGDARGRHGVRGTAAGRRDLLDVPAARLRPVDPRRRAAEPARDVRDRSRRPGRRRRRDSSGQLRPFVSALHSESRRDGAGRRERMPADAVHRRRSSINPQPCAIRAARDRRRRSKPRCARCRSARRRCGAKAAAGLRSSRSARWCRRASASPSKLDATLVNLRFVKPLDEELIVRIAATHRALVTVEENVVAGGAGSAINECLAATRSCHADAQSRHSRSLHRARLARGLPGGSPASTAQSVEAAITRWWHAARSGCAVGGLACNARPCGKFCHSCT